MSISDKDWGNLLLQEVKKLKGEPKTRSGSQYRWGSNNGFSVDADKGIWQDFSTGEGGGYKDFLKIHKGTTISEYHYGNTVKVRYQNGNGKDFRFFHPGEDGKLKFGQAEKKLPPYNWEVVTEDIKQVLICEGEKTADALASCNTIPVVTGGGAKDINNRDWTCLKGKQVILCRDNDESGETWLQDLSQVLAFDYECDVLQAEIPDKWGEKDDFADWAHEYQDKDSFLTWCLGNHVPMAPPIGCKTFGQMDGEDYKTPTWLVENLLAEGNQCIAYAKAGHGKSLFIGALLSNLASGHNFAGFNVPFAKKCLLIDGEMSLPELQKRYRKYFKTIKNPKMENLMIASVFFDDNPIGNLSDPENRQKLIQLIKYAKPDLIVLDNYFTLWSPEDHNSADSWQEEVMEILHFCRKRQIAVIVIDHSNKSSRSHSLFGSSVKVVTMDLVLRGEQSEDEDGIFTWHFEKARSLSSEHRNSFELRLEDQDGLRFVRSEKIPPGQRLRQLFDEGYSAREAEELMQTDYPKEKGFSKSSINNQFATWKREEESKIDF